MENYLTAKDECKTTLEQKIAEVTNPATQRGKVQWKALESQLKEKWDYVYNIYTQIETYCCQDESEERRDLLRRTIREKEVLRDSLIEAQAVVAEHISAFVKEEAVVSNALAVAQANRERPRNQPEDVKLPKLEMKTFDGDIFKWKSFWEQFKVCIGSNSRMDSLRKLAYLQSLLRGKAAELIEGLPYTEDAYRQAVDTLEEHYDNKEALVQAHLNKLHEIQRTRPATDLKSLTWLYNKVQIQIRSLEALQVPSSSYGSLLATSLLHKLPQEVLKDWVSDSSRDIKNLTELLKFIASKIRTEETMQALGFESGRLKTPIPQSRPSTSTQLVPFKGTTSALVACDEQELEAEPTSTQPKPSSRATVAPPCLFCSHNDHKSANCPLSLEERKRALRASGRCFICTRRGHRAADCDPNRKCVRCQQRHHVFICPQTERQSPPSTQAICAAESSTGQILATAAVEVIGPKGRMRCRCLFDTGSMGTYVTTRVANLLGLKKLGRVQKKICKFGGVQEEANLTRYSMALQNYDGQGVVSELTAYAVPKICSNVPVSQLKYWTEELKRIGLQPSEDENDLKSGRWDGSIDLLIGTKHFWQLLSGQTRRINGRVMALESQFGWIVHGDSDLLAENQLSVSLFLSEETEEPGVRELLTKIYEADEDGVEAQREIIDHPTVEHFRSTVERNGTAYVVRLPWNDNKRKLLSNQELAIRRAWSLFRRLKMNPELLKGYDRQFRENLELGFIEAIHSMEELSGRTIHYVPHHPVVRMDKASTKIRAVFNASEKGPGRLSLNDCLDAGPNLNTEMVKLLIRFRSRPVAVTGDIEKAFLKVQLHPEDRDAVRFVWFENIDAEKPVINQFRWKSVVFGVTCSPFLLTATLRHHASKFRDFPSAVETIFEDMFVDDVATGANDRDGAFELVKVLISILEQGNFNLRRLRTNDGVLQLKLNKIEGEAGAVDPISKVLGLLWNRPLDTLSLDMSPVLSAISSASQRTTFRSMMAIAAKLYDPIGFVTPVAIVTRTLVQEIWQRGIGWDQELPDDLRKRFWTWASGLSKLEDLKLSRWTGALDGASRNYTSLHVFGDASGYAYGAVAYLRVVTDGQAAVFFVHSRAKVAPLKRSTIHRQELLAAVLATEVAQTVKIALKRSDLRTFFWSDSMVTLYWLSGDLSRWKQYVANRVKLIRSRSNITDWRHVAGIENPADLCSRGVSAISLTNVQSIWWTGPRWLLSPEDTWCTANQQLELAEQQPEVACELKKAATFVLINSSEEQRTVISVKRYSVFGTLLRFTALILRQFGNVLRERLKKPRFTGQVTIAELNLALKYWLRQTQELAFAEDIAYLKKNGHVKKSSPLAIFRPYISSDGVLMLTSRNERDLPIVPGHLNGKLLQFVVLLIRSTHLRLLHVGVTDTLVDLRERFWITRGRPAVKSVLRSCVTCNRQQRRLLEQPAGPIPKARLSGKEPFDVVGVDFGGPLYVKPNSQKVWFCVFTCGSTRAVHLEVVPSLSAQSFVMALDRMVSRRGAGRLVYSDNAKTFKLMANELQKATTDRGIEWRFIPEYAPWWGGFWERMVGLVKSHFKKTVGRASLSLDELTTLLVKIEAVINSRPITFMYESHEEPEPLTPGHFLIGRRMTSLPGGMGAASANDTPTQQELTRRFRYRERLVTQFWNRW